MNARLLWSVITLAALVSATPVAVAPAVKVESFNGYAEWRRGDTILVDGQRVRATASTKFKGRDVTSLDAIPLGYEIKAKGVRGADGVVDATEIEGKPNGTALFETEVRQATDDIEAEWLRAGEMYEPKDDGRREVIGRLMDSGARADRVWEIVDRLRPPYVPSTALRVHVVRTEDWNAAAMGNGAIWIYSGLVDEMGDDELAIVLGHELAHYTHEHSRKAAKSGLWMQMLSLSALLAAETIDRDAARATAQIGALLAVTAFDAGYSRDQEDQADRVGLRYANEAGYAVSEGPRLWERFRQKYGNGNKVANFFFSGHSRPSDRIRNISKELAINYPDAIR